MGRMWIRFAPHCIRIRRLDGFLNRQGVDKQRHETSNDDRDPSPFDYAQGQDDDSKGFAQDDGFVK
jgi:hypothetical protein